MHSKRNVNLDLIRCTALICVLSVHFLLNNGFYKETIQGSRMYFMTIMRTGLMVCVPLFLLLSGYLMNQKILSRRYYLGIIKIIGVYILVCITNILLNIFYRHQDITLVQAVLSILDFTAIRYSWYIEMYIGLFLIIPFLNLVISGLYSKKHMQILIITMLILTTLPSMTNIFGRDIVADWWKNAYPITYYFIGAYIRKYDIKIKPKKNLLMLITVILFSGLFNCYMSFGLVFQKGEHVQWQSIQNVLSAVLLFILIKDLNLEKWPNTIKKAVVKISELSLGIYLCSGIFDTIFYKVLCNQVPIMVERLNYFIIIAPIVFLCSTMLAAILNSIYMLGYRWIGHSYMKG